MYLRMTMLWRGILAITCVLPMLFTQQGGRPDEPPVKSVAKAKTAPARTLTAEQKERFETGKQLYVVICGSCHQAHGNGQEGLSPPLAGSEWTLGSEERLVRLTLHGVRGPITVKGKVYELEMPALSILDDDQIAALLTYIRREWGHTASPVEPKTVAKIRAATEKRDDAWTEEELLKIP
ncbi:MAG: cytochrome c [Verrucomicrobia bacterium]|nr:cytochrome c [Verrucomicrobiota bacterium]